LALLFTTGTVSSGATALAENAGIIIRGGEQLAVFLADRGVGVSEQGGVKSFDSAKFSLWLAT
jgi:restriction endonuclease Mrr